MPVNDRVRQIRNAGGYTMRQFAARLGITSSAVSQIETGRTGISDQTILSICREFGIREEWLRTGAGEMKAEGDRAEELRAAVERLFSDETAKFQQALISSLLQFDPHGPQWRVVEEIFRTVASKAESVREDDRASLHAELDRQLDEEKRESSA